MDKRDIALQLQCPVVPVPKYSDLDRSMTAGERVLLASNGLFLESTRRWGRFVRKVGSVDTVLPFGQITESQELYCGPIPRSLILTFNEIAGLRSDVEIGASIIWNETTGQFRLVESTAIHATHSSLTQSIPPLGVGDHLVIDCHSHSRHGAFFSATDDLDDQNAVKFAYVVGHCHRPVKSTTMRLCVRGHYTKLDMAFLANA